LYWYEFPAWWQQQLVLRQAGRCPDWCRPIADEYRGAPIRNPQDANSPGRDFQNFQRGLIHLNCPSRDTADSLADILHQAGYATVWNPPRGPKLVVRGAVAGVWDGSQLDDRETENLADFCRTLARDASPVIALLDFPRRDRYELARQLGAAQVLGKPWINVDLVATINEQVHRRESTRPNRRAA
jgi:hypothetical protein